MAELILSLNQKLDKGMPYTFPASNVNVYSMEEALYYCFYNWKQAVEDFLSEGFILWVQHEQKLPLIAARLREIGLQKRSLWEKVSQALLVADYYHKDQVESLRQEIKEWENRLEWEKLKEQGDYYIKNSQPSRALEQYGKALFFQENGPLYNNAAIALTKMGQYKEAALYFGKAAEKDPENLVYKLNLIESLILGGAFKNAEEKILEVEKMAFDNPEISYFKGEIAFLNSNYLKSIQYYEEAYAKKGDEAYILRICDVYMKMRLYDKALEAIGRVRPAGGGGEAYKKQAEIHAASHNFPGAIKSIEKALVYNKKSLELWVRLAQYYRQDYDLNKAQSAIVTALAIDPHHPAALLERARISKAQGRIKDYQIILNQVLQGFKESYREKGSVG